MIPSRALVALLLPLTAQAQSQKLDFARDVMPIFERSCHSCHGPKLEMGGLRLDVKTRAFAGGQSGKVIDPGSAANSRIYKRVTGEGDAPRMPMGADPLAPKEIATLRDWIDQGAQWPDTVGAHAPARREHWAFIAPKRPAPPNVARSSWSRNPIDRFVLARLEKEKLAPSSEAGRAALLRRLSLDLIGLPPTIAEVDAFVNDRGANAYEKQVDRLLASPHYGERWARVWLDAARYADSDGFEKDKQRWVWFYRDWVINALNRDLPYDRFIVEQLAGDLLPNPTQDNLVATGFLRNSMINEEGGIDPEQFRMEAMFDRMDAIGKGVLGVTIQCAQCHTHKYDPLTHEDYYRLFAFLNNSHESIIAAYTPEEQRERDELFRQISAIESDLQRRTPDWKQRMARWEQQVRGSQPEWTVLHPEVDDISNGGQKYLPLADGSFLAQGYAPTKHRVQMTVKTELADIRAFRLELLNDPNLPLGGPGRSIYGTGALTEFTLSTAPADDPKKTTPVKLVRATADLNPPEQPLDPIFDDRSNRRRVTGPIEFAIDGKEETAWGIDAGPGRNNQPRKAVFVAESPVTHPGGTVLTFYLSQRHGGWNSDDNQNNNLGRMRLSVTTAPDVAADPVPAGVREVLSIPPDERTPEQQRAVFSYWRTTVPEWKEDNTRIDALWRRHPRGSSQLVLNERPEPRTSHILTRGDFLQPGKQVEPGTPAFLHKWPDGAPRNRLGLARWLVDRNSPTTARSIVNRIWQSYFGNGLVETSEDLGKQSEAPSHPELLDWLAVELMERGWSLKALHKSIVTSATYRQVSKVTPDLLSRDPYNRSLARGPRLRVDAEVVRDIALAASGLLNRKVGGPSVYPPAPAFLFQPPASYGPKHWHEEKDDARYRRGLYTFRYRSVPYPMLETFDAPKGEVSCVRRPRSNTPLQALVTLNEPLFVEAARALAKTTISDGGATDEQRLAFAFRRCLARGPAKEESAELLGFLHSQTLRLSEGWLNAHQLAGFEADEKLPPGATPVQLAAWTAVSRVLLNLDETITKE